MARAAQAAVVRNPMVPEPIEVTRVAQETRDTFTLRLAGEARPGGWRFLPGQFNMLYLDGIGEAPISMSGNPDRPQEIVHTIRVVGALTRALGRLRRGESVGVRGPFGTPWPLEEARGRDVVIVAGGIGLAPLRPAIYSILKDRRAYGRVTILYGSRTPHDLLYSQEIERWRGRFDLDVDVTVDQAERDWYGRVGVVTALIPPANVDPAAALAMVCGPELMMRFTVRELQKRGLPEDRIFISMERNMRCGIGLCGHCQIGPHFVCRDGPVFRLDRVSRLIAVREL